MITVTPEAAKHLKALIERAFPDNPNAGIRLAVKAGGCSGFSYLPLKPEPKPEDKFDEVYESNGVRIFVFKQILPFVKGTEIDFTNNLLQSNFVFNNPNAKQSCGCGSSFDLK